MWICRSCLAIVNGAAYDGLVKRDLRAIQATEFYSVPSSEGREFHQERLRDYEEILSWLWAQYSHDRSSATFLDFGAGRGYAALAASRVCRHAIICEWDVRAAGAVLKDLGHTPENIEIVQELKNASRKADILFMWHVLEHLPAPTEWWVKNCDALSEHFTAFVQIPLYRPAYVQDVHYIFFGKQSLTAWASQINAEVKEFGYDLENGFLTMIAQC